MTAAFGHSPQAEAGGAEPARQPVAQPRPVTHSQPQPTFEPARHAGPKQAAYTVTAGAAPATLPRVGGRPSPRFSEPGPLARLEHLSGVIVRRADAAKVEIEPLGVHPVFTGLRAYRTSADWIVCPAADDPLITAGRLPIPKAERAKLRRLKKAGLDFPHIYLAHELEGRPAGSTSKRPLPSGPFATVTPAQARSLVPEPSLPPKSLRRAARLGGVAQGLGEAAAVTAVGVGALALAPLGLLLLPFASLDPVVYGVVPLPGTALVPGISAAWFVLASWDW